MDNDDVRTCGVSYFTGYLNFELEKKLRHITQMEHDFGRNAADVVAEENLEKLRGFIAASPSLAGIIVDRIEAAQAKAAENAAHAAEAEEITAAEEPQETPFTQEEPQPAYASAEYEADVIETAEAAEEETYTAITEEEPKRPCRGRGSYAPAMPEDSEAAVDTPAETAAVDMPDETQDAPAASGEGEERRSGGMRMKNIFGIFRCDVRRITASVVSVIVIIGLCLVPCLYAWFNIMSNADPYGPASTSNIKVVVANEDEGSELLGLHFNIGDMVVDGISANDQMGWCFVDTREEAMDGLYAGDYYAALMVPRRLH